ncbi:hypothetical protein ACE41H_09785 [Paenibacillus enshidis]|uniref:Uncharacterized protein n=1 Tax=Paenibacillus enshidis TaxID=1458439 RepID=A0ABV5AS80_9BACL
MKAVPKVDIKGLYIEDVVVDDAFSGVVSFYSDALLSDLDQTQTMRRIAGYTVGIPVPERLYYPRFDLEAWDAYQKQLEESKSASETGQQELSTFWIEGLTPEEIAKLTAAPQQEPSETDQLKQRIADLELALAQLMAGKQK